MSHDPQDAHRTSYFLSPERLYLLLFALTVLCISLLLPVRSVQAKSLTGFCSNPFVVNGYAHCYAERTWTGYTGGAYVLINPTGALKCIGCANNATTPGFIDNEMWFTGDNGHWIEVGISTWPANDPNSCNAGHDSTCGFWADQRGAGTGGYHEHPLYNFGADGVDLTPYLFYAQVSNHTGTSSMSTSWDISTSIFKDGSFLTNPSGLSTSNNMHVNAITIGSELTDTHGSAASFYFEDNRWMDGGGNFQYQTNGGVNDGTNAPPNGHWSTTPCQCSGNTGGIFVTSD